jgi:predicted metal-dependent HD superfamily phosphohydrolase
VFFHDVIYDPKSSTNEEDSAKLFQAFSRERDFLKESDITTVTDYILKTKAHVTDAHLQKDVFGDSDLHVFLDLDMSILGSESSVYDQYAEAIRQEYIHVPLSAYTHGRAAVLEKFLLTPNIFSTATFRALLETKARENIAREIERLRGGRQ